MEVLFKKMCDGCYRMLGDNEQMFAFKLIDDDSIERIFKGHKDCVNDIVDTMKQLYGVKEDE